MKINDILGRAASGTGLFKNAPSAGQALIYTRKKVLFFPYLSERDVIEKTEGEELLEVHLFDSRKEYRAILTESRRFPGGIIESVSDFADEKESVYKEEILLENSTRKITVLNHLKYGQNGMVSIDDYRLIM